MHHAKDKMLRTNHKAISAQEAFEIFQKEKNIINSKIVKFEGVDGYDVYNPSVPFIDDNKKVIAGRVEDRGDHISRIMFFEEREGSYYLLKDYPVYEMEDPFVTFVQDELILGGVEVEWKDAQPVGFKTVFMRGKNIKSLKRFTEGPKNMKDIRLCELKDKRIVVFTRPRNLKKLEEWGSIARIGINVIKDLHELNAHSIENATLLEGHFTGFEWGGANQALLLNNGLVGVIGHRSWGMYKSIQESELHYYGIVFAIHPDTYEMTKSRIIISRDCFPEGPAKLPGLSDVTFTAGLIRHDDKTATVYSGLSDAAVGCALIEDPFYEWERIKIIKK